MSTTALAVTLPTVQITVTTASVDPGGGVEGIGRNDYAQGTERFYRLDWIDANINNL